jgi:hypothetical protein
LCLEHLHEIIEGVPVRELDEVLGLPGSDDVHLFHTPPSYRHLRRSGKGEIELLSSGMAHGA